MGNVVASDARAAALYTTGRKIASNVSGLFDLYEGSKNDASAEKVSIFIFDPSKASGDAAKIVEHAAGIWNLFADSINVGKVGYDGFIRVLSIDNETGGVSSGGLSSFFSGSAIRIVTESVTPLADILRTRDLSEDESMLGLFQVIQSLETLHSQNPPLAHSNLAPSTIFVNNKTGIWKIGYDWALPLKEADKLAHVRATASIQDPSSVSPEFSPSGASLPSQLPSDWPIYLKESWGFSSCLLAIPGTSAISKLPQFAQLRASDPSQRTNPAILKENKIFRDRKSTSILGKLFNARKDESKEKQLFGSIVSDIRTGNIDPQGRALLCHYLLKASLVTKTTASEAKLTNVLFSCGKSGLVTSSDFSRLVRPFIEWAWKLESHPLKTQLRRAVCQHASAYMEYMTSKFIEQEMISRIMAWMKAYQHDLESAMYSPDAAVAWIAFVLNASEHSPSGNSATAHLHATARNLGFDMLRMLPLCSSLAFRKRIIISTSSLMALDFDWGDQFYELFCSLTSVDPTPSMRRFSLWRLQKLITEDSVASKKMPSYRIAQYFISSSVPLLTDPDASVRDRARKAIRKFTLAMEKKDPEAGSKPSKKGNTSKSSTSSQPASPTTTQITKSSSQSSFDWGDEDDDNNDFSPISPVSKPSKQPIKSPVATTAAKKAAITPTRPVEDKPKPVIQKIEKSSWDDWDSEWGGDNTPQTQETSTAKSSFADEDFSALSAAKPSASILTSSLSTKSLAVSSFDDGEDAEGGWDDFESPALPVASKPTESIPKTSIIVEKDTFALEKPIVSSPSTKLSMSSAASASAAVDTNDDTSAWDDDSSTSSWNDADKMILEPKSTEVSSTDSPAAPELTEAPKMDSTNIITHEESQKAIETAEPASQAAEEEKAASSITASILDELADEVDAWGADEEPIVSEPAPQAPQEAPTEPTSIAVSSPLSPPTTDPIKPAAQKIDISFDDEEW